MKQEPTLVHSLANAALRIPCAVSACFRSLVIALLAFGLSQSAYSTVALESYWPLGEGAAIGTDTASGTANPFNNTTGSTLLTASPAVAGSTAYAHTSGVNFQGIWMFGAGSTAQTVPADDWGVQFNVRIPTLPGTGTFKSVFGMAEGVARPPGGLVIEANNVGGTTYLDVNKQQTANYIITRTPATEVTANTWYNLALVKSGGTMTFYINGVAVGSNATAISTSGLLGLGFEQNVGTHQLAGDFDEARFFTFAPGAFTTTDLNRLTVAYDGNGNTGGTAPADSGSYYSSTSVTVLGAGTLTKSGNVFTGWNTQADGLGTSYNPAATFNIGGANTTLYAQWASASATITAVPTFPSAVTTTYGTASGSTSVAISGTSLSGDITATAPSNLEVSSDNITFGTTATFIQGGGSASGTLYVRIKNNAPVSGSPYDSQSVVLTSPGATPVNVATAAGGNTVAAKNLTVPSATAQSKMYDGTTAGIVTGTLQAAEAFGAGNIGDGMPYIGDTLTVSAPGTFSSSAVGGPYSVTAGTFTLGGISAGNYTLTQPTLGALTASILNTATWTQPAGGTWTNSANWLNGIVGTGADNTADFSTLDLTGTTTVTLPSPQTIGGLIFDDATTADNNWVVSGSTLTLDAATTPVINVIAQTTTISSVLASANGLSKTGTGTLALSSITSGSVNLTANDGTLRLAVPFGGLAFNNAGGLNSGGTLTVNTGATLQISGAYNVGFSQAVNIDDGTLDIVNNVTGDGQNYTLNLNFTNGGSIISSTGSALRWGELANATITVNGTTSATISSSLRMIPGNSRTGTINVVDPAGNLDFSGNIIDFPTVPGGVPLIKTGAGMLTLTGTNNYTSNTTVNAGTLTLAAGAQLGFTLGATSETNNSISGAGTVVLDGNFAINTTAAAALTAGTWTLENVPLLAGPYGATFSVVGFTDAGSDTWTLTAGSKLWTFVETTGVLTLSPSVSYTTWIDGFTFALGADKTPTGDPDNDGLNNATEMVSGGNPATGMDAALAPTIELVTADVGAGSINYLLFTFRRTDLSVTAALTSNAQYGSNLSSWAAAVDGVDGVVVQVDDNFTFVPPSPNTDRVRVYVPRGISAKLFGRLNITVP